MNQFTFATILGPTGATGPSIGASDTVTVNSVTSNTLNAVGTSLIQTIVATNLSLASTAISSYVPTLSTMTNVVDNSTASNIPNQMWYFSLGAIKIAYGGVSYRFTSASSPGYIVFNLPTGFFNSVSAVNGFISQMIHLPQQFASGTATTSVVAFYVNVAGGNDGASTAGRLNVFIVGT